MKLKQIPNDTVVHTPTEAEAKELLAILHENGHSITYTLRDIKEVNGYEDEEICFNIAGDYLGHSTKEWYQKKRNTIITLAEFKQKYCEEDKPQPKFKVGDKVIVATTDYNLKDDVGGIGVITKIMPHGYHIKSSTGEWFAKESDLALSTEPETKDETIETEDDTKELNLCELIGDREGIHVYCPTCGEVALQAWDRGKNTKPLIFAQNDTSIVVRTFATGKAYAGGECIIFPSRALYKQYPLDPYAAWMKWQQEQKKIILQICYAPLIPDNIPLQAQQTVLKNLVFRTPADRDKCIEEIKAIIKKYSKK